MSIPYDLVWTGIEYKFVGMILHDTTRRSEHFIGCVMIDNKLYLQEMDGFLRPLDVAANRAQSFTLSVAIPEGSNTFPSRIYYYKSDERDGPSDWTNVNLPVRESSDSEMESESEVRAQTQEEEMEMNDVDNGTPPVTKFL
jgi:hypothetical protein